MNHQPSVPVQPRPASRPLATAIALGAIVFATAAYACNVPVFRYALEHWSPDAYQGVVFHRGPLSEPVRKRLESFRDGGPDAPGNLAIRTVDLDANPEPADVELAASLPDAALPRLVVRYPARHQIGAVVWSGPVEDASVQSLIDSEARQEIIKRLVAGQTAVWVLVASGDVGQDDAAELTLDEELRNLQKTLKLPERTDAPEDAIGDGPELRVEFSILRIDRSDPAESALVSMLIHSEPDLTELKEPLVFPVFGRGRSLLPLVGPGISAENIRGSARFLAGACSCQVKDQNPGFDLLVGANWAELIPWAKSPANAVDALALAKPPELLPIAAGIPATAHEEPAATVVASESSVKTPPDVADDSAAAVSKAAMELSPAPDDIPESVPVELIGMGAFVAVLIAIAGFLMARR